jgi:hypothetical protein
MTSMSGENSASACLQTPQGHAGRAPSQATATETNSLSPAATAEKSAVRSAQQVGVNDTDSTLQPMYIFPLAASKHAPTRKLEYGE